MSTISEIKINIRRSMLNNDLIKMVEEYANCEPQEDCLEKRYFGTVIDNNDPEKWGRCKIRVEGIFGDGIQDSDLPWSIPDFGFLGSSMGNFIVPKVNTRVCVYFDHGDVYCPRYDAKGLDVNNLPSQREENYPDNMVMYATDEGDYLTLNRETKEFYLYHNSGSNIQIDRNGNITATATRHCTIEGTRVNLGINATHAVLKGDLFQALYNAHIHTGGFVAPTSPPTIPSNNLSTKVFSE